MTELVYPPCKYCGASHGMGVEEMATGKIEPMDICYTCLWKPLKINRQVSQVELQNHVNGIEELLK